MQFLKTNVFYVRRQRRAYHLHALSVFKNSFNENWPHIKKMHLGSSTRKFPWQLLTGYLTSTAINYRLKLKMAAQLDSAFACGQPLKYAALWCYTPAFIFQILAWHHSKISNVHMHNARHTTKEKSRSWCVFCVPAPPQKLTSHHWSGEFFKPHPWRPSKRRFFSTLIAVYMSRVLYDPTLRLAARTRHVYTHIHSICIPSLHGHYSGIIVINVVRREQIGNMCEVTCRRMHNWHFSTGAPWLLHASTHCCPFSSQCARARLHSTRWKKLHTLFVGYMRYVSILLYIGCLWLTSMCIAHSCGWNLYFTLIYQLINKESHLTLIYLQQLIWKKTRGGIMRSYSHCQSYCLLCFKKCKTVLLNLFYWNKI